MDLEVLAQKVRETLKTELDYYEWKTSGALRIIKTSKIVEDLPEYQEISDEQIVWVMNRVTELIGNK